MVKKTPSKLAIEFRKPDDVKPYRNNAKSHPPEQVKLIAEQIKAFGFDQPIVITKNGTIIKGHGRREAALLLGLKTIPVVVSSMTERQARAARIGDNKVSEASWIPDILKIEFNELDEALRALTAFNIEEVSAHLRDVTDTKEDTDKEWEGMPEFDQQDKTAFKTITVHFHDQDAVDKFAKLVKQPITENTRMLWYPEMIIERAADKRYGAES